jgi:hypothetical protein
MYEEENIREIQESVEESELTPVARASEQGWWRCLCGSATLDTNACSL